MPEPGPFGETYFDANTLAMVTASLVNKPGGGKVETVVTSAIHFFFFVPAMGCLTTVVFRSKMQLCGAEPPCGRPALGLKDNQVVTLDEVEQKFRNLAKKLHPDQGGQDESHARSD